MIKIFDLHVFPLKLNTLEPRNILLLSGHYFKVEIPAFLIYFYLDVVEQLNILYVLEFWSLCIFHLFLQIWLPLQKEWPL